MHRAGSSARPGLPPSRPHGGGRAGWEGLPLTPEQGGPDRGVPPASRHLQVPLSWSVCDDTNPSPPQADSLQGFAHTRVHVPLAHLAPHPTRLPHLVKLTLTSENLT